jgi:hypothetical protein
MAAFSDKLLISAVVGQITADSDLYDIADVTKLQEVFNYKFAIGNEAARITYASVYMRRGNVTLTSRDKSDITMREVVVEIKTKQIRQDNDDRLYDLVAKLRDNIKGTPGLGVTGVGTSKVATWDYTLNQTSNVIDGALCVIQVEMLEDF